MKTMTTEYTLKVNRWQFALLKSSRSERDSELERYCEVWTSWGSNYLDLNIAVGGVELRLSFIDWGRKRALSEPAAG